MPVKHLIAEMNYYRGEQDRAAMKVAEAEEGLSQATARVERVKRRDADAQSAADDSNMCLVAVPIGGWSTSWTCDVARIVRQTKSQIIIDHNGRERRYRKSTLKEIGGGYRDRISHVHPKWTEDAPAGRKENGR